MKKINLKIRLMAGFIIVALITMIVGGIGFIGITNINNNLVTVGEKQLPSVTDLGIINEAQTAIMAAQRTLLMTGTDDDRIDKELENISQNFAKAEEAWNRYELLSLSTQEEQLWNEFVTKWDVWKSDNDEFISLILVYQNQRSSDNYSNARLLAMSSMSKSFYDASSLLAGLIEYTNNDVLALKESSHKSSNLYKTMSIAGIIAGSVVAVIWGLFLSNSISKSLMTVTNKLSRSSKLVAGSSKQLASSGLQLSEGSTEQAASIEETSATMDQTASMVKQNAENTVQANNLSKQASEAAIDGSDKMNKMTSSMDELKKSSSDIAKIIKVIDEIAFQTNMLALNAAVEAARAGDAGLGFAVVAEEVRNLAQKSAQAAKNTTEIIDKNIELSEQGVSISEDVNVSLDGIITKTNNVNQIMEKISIASEEQSKGTIQVTEAISQMEKVVQSNAATAEESAASAHELQKQANSLYAVVNELNRLVKGENSVNFVGSSSNEKANPKSSSSNDEVDSESSLFDKEKIKKAFLQTMKWLQKAFLQSKKVATKVSIQTKKAASKSFSSIKKTTSKSSSADDKADSTQEVKTSSDNEKPVDEDDV